MTDADTARLVILESELAEAKRQLADRVGRSALEQRVLDAAIAWSESSELADAVEALVAERSPPAVHILHASYPLCRCADCIAARSR